MLEFKAHSFVRAMDGLRDMEAIGLHDAQWVYQDQTRIQHMNEQLDEVLVNLEVLGLRQSIRKAKFIKTLLGTGPIYSPTSLAAAMNNNMGELRDRIVGELEERAIYFVEDSKAVFLRLGQDPFGVQVADQFKNTSEDISEAAHCLAMARNTAAVFHLMRVMEIAVHRLGEMLRCTVVDKNNVDLEWGKILGNIRDKVEEMPKGEIKDEWSEVITLLYHVKQA